ncbi:SAGA-associated factor 29 [Anthonomus grandis grandis]|uniref:SAGA-associated factor 29 n=1 Tax=Anthonomus grandis grandis TaxID=2921223 RepID=UPI0021668F3B|nr:SAGA-associated factor 29 [Anthonomus grandis grandis]
MPFTADAIAAQQVQERLKSLFGSIHDIEKKRGSCEQSIANLQKYSAEEKGQNSQKSKSLIKAAMVHTDAEREAIQKALQKIYEIRQIKNERRIQARTSAANKESIRRGTWMKMLQTSAQTLPLFVGKVGEKVPPLCGAVPQDKNYVGKVGDMVAALVKGREEEMWILAEIVSYNTRTSKYKVDDILKEQNQKDRHTLSKRRVIPLPLMRASPETNPEALFQKGTLVMALFPQTTCFYKALINKPPQTHVDDYELLFEDPSYPEGFSPPLNVAQRYVIQCKEEKGSSSSVQEDSDSDS